MSIGFHVLLVAVAWFFSRDSGPRIDLNKPIEAHLVRLGEKRDEKLLPRMDNNAPPPAPEPVAIPDKPSPSAPIEPKKQQPKPQPKKDVTKDLFAAFDKTKPIHQDKVTGQADGDVNGDVDNASEGERYFGLISSRVKRNYDVSNAISDAERVKLVANIAIYIDAQGNVVRTEWVQKSGNDQFDAAVKSAVARAAPFPPPPQFLAASLSKQGVALKFRP
ncbi:MAG: TonB family protein [Deltaproteobacteria bacterium]|nr:TonB family protein [Deltaproteobacteria bacterium]